MSQVSQSLHLYLASTSPRRLELLQATGWRFALCPPGAEYEDQRGEHEGEPGRPAVLATERARRKALGAAPSTADVPVLAVDTVVDLAGRELGKAADRAAARAMLLQLSGCTHLVHTAHCLVHHGAVFEELATAKVSCRQPSADELERYLDSGLWRGKAGGYGIQDEAQDFLALADGSFDTVVGLHVPAVRRLLRRAEVTV